MTNTINHLPTVAHRIIARSILHAPTLPVHLKTELLRQLNQQPKTTSSGHIKRSVTPIVIT